MIKNLRLGNFQGFSEPIEVELRPLTFIFGANASGKSSILRSLLLLRQSVRRFGNLSSSGVRSRQNGFIFEGSEVSLANFTNVVNMHDEDAILSLGVSIVDLKPALTSSSMPALDTLIEKIDIDYLVSKADIPAEITYVFNLSGSQNPLVLRFNSKGLGYGLSVENQHLLTELLTILPSRELASDLSDVDEISGISFNKTSRRTEWQKELGELSFALRGIAPVITGYATSPAKSGNPIPHLVSRLLNFAEMQLSQMATGKHVGPLREISNRLDYSGAKVTNSEYEADVSLVKRQREERRRREAVSEWLLKLTDNRYRFKNIEFVAEDVRFLGKMNSNVVIDTKTNTIVTLADVGVGISQVLPILEALVSYQGSISVGNLVTIEQPELHLHPRMQAHLADLIIDSILDSRTQVIAETHSEAMLHRVLRRVREGKLNPDLVSIVFVEHDDAAKSNTAYNLELSESSDYSVELPISFGALRLDDLLS